MQIGNDFSYEIVRIGKKLKSLTIEAPIWRFFISPADAVKLQKWPYAAHRAEVLKCLSAKVRSQQKLDLLIFIDTSRHYFMPFRKYWCVVYHKRHPSLGR